MSSNKINPFVNYNIDKSGVECCVGYKIYPAQHALSQVNLEIKSFTKANFDNVKLNDYRVACQYLHANPHPNIIKIIDIIETSSKLYIVSETSICDWDISYFLKNKFIFTEREVRPWLKQLVEFLIWVSQHHIKVNLTSQNIYLKYRGGADYLNRYKTDIVISNDVLQPIWNYLDDTEYFIPGTKTYVSNLGIIMYNLFFHTHPEFSSQDELVWPANTHDVISNELFDLLNQMLKTNQKHRITITECLNSSWFNPIEYVQELLQRKINDIISNSRTIIHNYF